MFDLLAELECNHEDWYMDHDCTKELLSDWLVQHIWNDAKNLDLLNIEEAFSNKDVDVQDVLLSVRSSSATNTERLTPVNDPSRSTCTPS